MNKPLRKLTVVAVLLGVGTLISARQAAAAPKPALTVVFAGYDQFVTGLKALDQLSSSAKLVEKFEGALKQGTGGKGLAGLDKARPWGVLVSVDESNPPVIQGYLPANSLKQFLSVLPLPGGVPDANANGVYELPGAGSPAYAKQVGKWAVVSNNEEALGSAEDPTSAFSGLAKKYLISIRGSVQNVPAAKRDEFLKGMSTLVQIGLAAQPAGSDEERAMQQASVKQLFDKMEKLSKELDSLVIGIGIDPSTKSTFLDVEMKGVSGSSLAKKFGAMGDAKTDFAGFAVSGAAMSVISSGTSDDEDVAEAKATLNAAKANISKSLDANEGLDDKKRDLAKKLVGDLFDVIEKTAEMKKSDGGFSIVLDNGPVAILGVRIAGGGKLNTALKKLVTELAADAPQLKDIITIDAEKYEGVTFHVAKIPLPDPKAAAVLGDSVQIVVGTSETGLYFGAGKDPVAAIKKAMDASKAEQGKLIAPVDMVVSVSAITKFFAKVVPDNNDSDAKAKKGFEKAVTLLAKSPGKDHVTLKVTPISDGMLMRLNVESGIIKMALEMMPGGDAEE